MATTDGTINACTAVSGLSPTKEGQLHYAAQAQEPQPDRISKEPRTLQIDM